MVGAPLGMADNNRDGAGIGQHFGGDIARMRASRLGVTILAANGDLRAAHCLGKTGYQGRRRTNHQVGCNAGRAVDNAGQFAGSGGKPVHLPVARDQRA
jgi:hypothetical protein